ncbi:MAG TPA: helix-turn-helix domain-containing protein [Jiangellaceae bacterium]|nr:helix-turn-helix domain-containing protein [Jiangellaceae bacterium]
MDEKLLTAQEIADFLGVPLATVYVWSTRGTGPRALRVGRHLRYRRRDVDAWLDTRGREAQPA